MADQTTHASTALGRVSRSKAGFSTNIHYLRGVAALAVLLFHLTAYSRMLLTEHIAPVFDWRFSIYGVAIFFSISGYLMANLATKYDPFTFISHRVARIYPTLFIVVFLAWTAFSIFANPLPVSFAALSLAPVGHIHYPLGVEWTLVFEMSFYVLITFVLMLRLGEYLPALGFIWLLAIMIAYVLGIGAASDLVRPEQVPLAYASAAFAGGLTIPWLVRLPASTMIGLAILVPLPLFLGLDYAGSRVAIGIATTVLVVIATRTAMTMPSPAHNVLSWLGDCSYALYLCHVPVIRLVYHFGKPEFSSAALWLLAGAASLAVAAIIGPIDNRIYEQIRNRLNKSSGVSLTFFGVLFIAIFAATAFFAAV